MAMRKMTETTVYESVEETVQYIPRCSICHCVAYRCDVCKKPFEIGQKFYCDDKFKSIDIDCLAMHFCQDCYRNSGR